MTRLVYDLNVAVSVALPLSYWYPVYHRLNELVKNAPVTDAWAPMLADAAKVIEMCAKAELAAQVCEKK